MFPPCIIIIMVNKSVNKLAGLPRSHTGYTIGDGRKGTAIVINNDQLDATLITQLSNEDCVTVEVHSEAVKFYSVSRYFNSCRHRRY